MPENLLGIYFCIFYYCSQIKTIYAIKVVQDDLDNQDEYIAEETNDY